MNRGHSSADSRNVEVAPQLTFFAVASSLLRACFRRAVLPGGFLLPLLPSVHPQGSLVSAYFCASRYHTGRRSPSRPSWRKRTRAREALELPLPRTLVRPHLPLLPSLSLSVRASSASSAAEPTSLLLPDLSPGPYVRPRRSSRCAFRALCAASRGASSRPRRSRRRS